MSIVHDPVRQVEPSRALRLRAPVVTTGGLAVAAAALHLRDPHVSGAWAFCPSAALGVWCPGCGGLRAVHDITDLRLVDAASSNLLLVLAMPVVLVLLARWVLDAWAGRVRRPLADRPRAVITTLALVVLAVFTLLRNLPAGSWLAP